MKTKKAVTYLIYTLSKIHYFKSVNFYLKSQKTNLHFQKILVSIFTDISITRVNLKLWLNNFHHFRK